ncbi:protein-L-isoaspartate(D-aspartate) O-methyltransferase [Isachenkonia alkalipeptolytica]|uniref:Protein-L-isoaspartate O-methyltransferase n=1 Tax=Isachenkonia alkalipeptolytica TaxID=2565777 RepID=A0AA43XLU2_9CLOT|nr:protein-L-isoaspartate(D-aspartate) O-methyltransferase [Isachenkonia alkalipeptolytica]NBG88599.1 protein-L-isoaspartate(D-aspartate) O-methyltransferase [Isachenkonia alkalipeptolytica]
MDNNALLVQKIEANRILKTPSIKEALLAVDRKDFVLPRYTDYAYLDRPLPIGEGQTISQPSTVVFMLELLQAEKGHKVLDAGSGSGWTTALLSHIVGPRGKVIAMELLPSLKTFGEENFKHAPYENGIFLQGNGAKGVPEEAPFDRILISAGAREIPSALLDQLAEGGKLVLPLQDRRGNLVLVEKRGNNDFHKSYYPGFAFVPFITDRE